MIEACQKPTSEAIDRIKEGEKLCKEAIDQVFATWELLLEDEKVEKIIEDLRQTKLQITSVKADMKKLHIGENIGKVVKLKKLQQ